jgi:hopanoid-associated phosphorylase
VTLGAGARAAHIAVEGDELPVLIVTGLRQEARIAAGPGLTVICSSSNPVQLREMMTSFDPKSIRGIVSFGVAGGLNPALKTGDIVIASRIVTAKRQWATDSALTEDIVALPTKRGRSIVHGVLAGVEEVVTGQIGKEALRATTGADAVDMESHIAARYAEYNGLPFAAVRVVSDPSHRALPQITIPHLISTGRDFNRALRSLRGCRSALG